MCVFCKQVVKLDSYIATQSLIATHGNSHTLKPLACVLPNLSYGALNSFPVGLFFN